MIKVSFTIILVITLYLFITGCKRAISSDSRSYKNELANIQVNTKQYKDSIFFLSFPDNFNAFNEIYGYSDKDGPGQLYNQYDRDLKYFCDSINVKIEDKINKLISLSIGGKWDADAVSELQRCVRQEIGTQPKIFFELLSQKSAEELKAFWYFILDCAHPEDKEQIQYFKDLYLIAQINNPNQLNLIKETHEEILLKEH